MTTKVIIELKILKVNGIREKELRNKKGFQKGTSIILDNLLKEMPKHFKNFRMEVLADGRIEMVEDEKDE